MSHIPSSVMPHARIAAEPVPATPARRPALGIAPVAALAVGGILVAGALAAILPRRDDRASRDTAPVKPRPVSV